MEEIFVNYSEFIRNIINFLGIQAEFETIAMSFFHATVILTFIMLNAIIIIVLERKVAGFFQLRPGPNRFGPFGMFQSVADVVKLFGKELIIPRAVDKWVFIAAVLAVFVPALMLFAVIPFGKEMVAVDLNVGILYFFAISSTATIACLMGGWSSNNKYSLLGAMRSVAQTISYEIPLVLSLIGVIMIVGSLQLSEIVAAQENMWFAVMQPVAFVIFFIAAIAELNRGPFDLPEGEQEIIAGPYTEYSGMMFALFFLAEYANLISISAITVTVFLGGWQGPFLPSWLWFVIKLYVVIFLFMWVRWTFPRIRVDHLMSFNWKYLIPIALVNIVVTGVVVKFIEWFKISLGV